MTSADLSKDNFKFIMASQREQELLKDPQAKEKNETIDPPIGSLSLPSSASLAMAPPGIEMGSESGSLELSDSPDKNGDRKRRGGDKSRERSPRRTPSASGRSDSGSRRPPASRSSSVKPGGPTPRSTPRTSRASSRKRSGATPWADDLQAVHRKVAIDTGEPFGPNFAKGIALQMQADREHMEVLKLAIEGLFVTQQQQGIDLSAQLKHINVVAESSVKLKSACKTHAEQTDERFTWIHENVKPAMASIIQEIIQVWWTFESQASRQPSWRPCSSSKRASES